MKKKTAGLLLVLISGAVFGAMPGLVTYCKSEGANNALMLLFRFGILALIVLPLALRDGGLGRALRENWKPLLFLSVTEGVTPLLLYVGYDHLATGLVMTLHFLYPMLVTLLCVLAYREKLSPVKLFCLALCLAGVVLTLDLTSDKISVFGVVLALLSALTYAAYIVWLNKSAMRHITSTQIAFFVGVGCFLVALIYALISGSLAAVTQVSAKGWLAMTAAGTIIAAGGSLLMILGTRRTDAQTAAIASTLEPLTSIVVGVLFLEEPMNARIGIGCFCILAAVVILARLTAKER